MEQGLELKVVDMSGLTDADWAAINKVIRACANRDLELLRDEIDKLGDPARQIKVAMAFLPDLIREALKDEMAEQGITQEDLKEFLWVAGTPRCQPVR